MTPATTERLLHHLRRLLVPAGTPDASDRQLLERFTASRDEAAFAILVGRHGPMVLGVCRRVLGNRPATEDAFQATFLTLARRAASIRRRDTVGGWLYGVAHRLALKARAEETRRHHHEHQAAARRPSSVSPDDACRELRAVLDEELLRLPERYRLPLLLCYREGHTQDEAAREVGWSLSTLRRRLERGRELLRGRLARRGATLSAGLFAAALATEATAAVPACLARAAVRLAVGAGAVPATVEALARTGLGGVWLAKGKAALVLLLAAVAAGAWAGRGDDPPKAPPDAPGAPAAAKPLANLFGDPLPPGALVRLGTSGFQIRGNVRALAVSPDGKWLAGTGDYGPEVRVWDTATGRTVRSFPGRCYFDFDLAFSPDGKRLALAEANGPFHVWDVAAGREEFVRQNPAKGKYWLFAAAFTAAGTPVMVFRGDGDMEPLSLHDGRTGERLCTFDRDLRGRALARAADRKSIAVSLGTTVSVMALDTGKELRSLPGHGADVTGLALSADGQRLACAADGDAVYLWDVADGKELLRLPVAAEDAKVGRCVALSDDGRRLAVAGYRDRTVRLHDTGGKELRRLVCPDMVPSCLAFSPDGKALVAGGTLGVRVWDTATGQEWHADRPGHTGNVDALVYAPDGKSLVSGGRDGTVRLWDARTGKHLRLLAREPDARVERLAFAPDGKSVASALWGGVKTTVRDAATAKVRLEFDGSAKHYSDVAFSPDGRFLAVGEGQGQVTLRAADTGRLVRTLVATEKEQPGSLGLTFSPDGRRLAGNRGWKTVLWDVETGREYMLEGPRCSLGLSFTPDGETLVGGLGDTVTLWRVGTRKKAGEFRVPMKEAKKGSEYELSALALAPDGRTVVVSSSDGSLSFWEVASLRERFRLTPPDAPVRSLAFAPDGRTLATGDGAGTALVWDVASLPEPLRVPERTSAVDLARLWSGLADADAAAAYRSLRTLAALPARAVPLLREHLRPVTAPDPALLKRLLGELDGDEFATREKAIEELAKLGEGAVPALREATASPSAEVRRRAEGLLDRLKPDAPDALRRSRAVEALERCATPEARRLLEALAGGLPAAPLSREAQAALGRLDGSGR